MTEILETTTGIPVNVSFDDDDDDSATSCHTEVLGLTILRFCVIPLVCVLGVCGNVEMVVVWNADTVFSPTYFLMKCLAVTDTLLFVSWLLATVGTFAKVRMLFTITGTILSAYFVVLSFHTTLAVGVARWIAIYKPLKFRIILSQCRMRVAFTVLTVWCAAGRVLNVYLRTVYLIVFLGLPVILLVVLSASLLWKVRAQRNGGASGQQGTSSTTDHHRLVGAVLAICIATLITYPPGVALYTLLPPSPYVVFICMLIVVYNASINVVFYLAFSSKFRHMCQRRCCCC